MLCYYNRSLHFKGWGHFYWSRFCADLVPNNSPPRFSQLPTNINPKPHMPGLTLNSTFLRSFPHLIPLSFYSQPHIHLSYHIHFTWTSLDRIIPVPKYYVRKGTLSWWPLVSLQFFAWGPYVCIWIATPTPKKDVEAQTPGSQNATVFGNRVVTDIIS